MGEVVNVIVAFAVIVFIVRWATSSKDSPAEQSASSALGFRPKNVTPDMVDTIHNMFPDIPSENIRYDLLRTGSVQLTSNKILERGFLPAPPPAYFTVYPRAAPDTAPTDRAPNARPIPPVPSGSKSRSENLISRYRLEERVASGVSSSIAPTPEQAAGKAVWEDTAEKREASLRERKAQMILAARQRLLAQQQKEAGSASAS